ncbi:MAG: bacillithiol biosynthesis cysteine-adding enzyme BshC [Candidatus Hydrogenedentes bacterium]|nr:bacillithiol biosynthesis cysteine-adding enzyme BshC [Candidatus Hydrogenedentota bacterium]
MSSLLHDYCNGAPALSPFFEQPLNAFCAPSATARAWDPGLLDAVQRYQQRLGIERSICGDEHAIVTGQQPGLLTGPLYTIYKAITALKLARKFNSQGNARVQPIFWVGSDDHDFEEVRTAHLLSKKHETLSLSYAPAQDIDRFPMYHVPVESSLHALIDEAADQAPGSEWRAEVQAFLHESLDASASFSDWNARIMAKLFAATELLIFAPDLPEARRAAAPVFRNELEHPLRSTHALNEAGRMLETAGFEAQVVKDSAACNLFVVIENRRCRVRFENGRFHLPDAGLQYTQGEFLKLLDDDPQAFTPNVALRCLVQQHLFPTLAYVAGPGELAYWGQLKPLFTQFALPMPVVYPRAQGRISSMKLNKLLGKLHLDPDALLQPLADLEDTVMRASAANPAHALLQTHRAGLQALLDRIALDVTPLQKKYPNAGSHAGRFRETVGGAWDRFERALVHLDDTQSQTIQQQVQRLQTAFAPFRKPQERVYSVFSHLFEYGWELIPRLIAELDVESFTMNEIEL